MIHTILFLVSILMVTPAFVYADGKDLANDAALAMTTAMGEQAKKVAATKGEIEKADKEIDDLKKKMADAKDKAPFEKQIKEKEEAKKLLEAKQAKQIEQLKSFKDAAGGNEKASAARESDASSTGTPTKQGGSSGGSGSGSGSGSGGMPMAGGQQQKKDDGGGKSGGDAKETPKPEPSPKVAETKDTTKQLVDLTKPPEEEALLKTLKENAKTTAAAAKDATRKDPMPGFEDQIVASSKAILEQSSQIVAANKPADAKATASTTSKTSATKSATTRSASSSELGSARSKLVQALTNKPTTRAAR